MIVQAKLTKKDEHWKLALPFLFSSGICWSKNGFQTKLHFILQVYQK